MNKKRHGIVSSFGFAFKGCRMLFQSERNVKLHVLAIALVTILGFLLEISFTEWAVVVMCAGGVLAAEAINTSIEEIVDLLHPERSERAGRIKDIAAAGVLIMSIAALVTGLLIFLPKITVHFL